MLQIIFLVASLLVTAQGQLTTQSPSTLSSPPALNNTTQLLVQRIGNTLININQYVTEVLELLLKLFKAVSDFVTNLKTNNATIDISQLTKNIQESFNLDNGTCYQDEEYIFGQLVMNTTMSIEKCVANTNESIRSLIPQVITLLTGVIQTVRNVSSGVQQCFKDNPMMISLPMCIMEEITAIQNDVQEFKTQLNATLTEGNAVVTGVVTDISCVQNTVTRAQKSIIKILGDFVNCIIAS